MFSSEVLSDGSGGKQCFGLIDLVCHTDEAKRAVQVDLARRPSSTAAGIRQLPAIRRLGEFHGHGQSLYMRGAG